MQKEQRLRKSKDFRKVRNKGRNWHSNSMVLLAFRRPFGHKLILLVKLTSP